MACGVLIGNRRTHVNSTMIKVGIIGKGNYVKRMMIKLEDEIEDEVEEVANSRQWILFI